MEEQCKLTMQNKRKRLLARPHATVLRLLLMMMSVWTRPVETEADVQTTGFVNDSAVRSKRGKTRNQAVTNLRQAWEVSKEFGQKAETKCNRKKVKMIASDENTEKEMEGGIRARGTQMHKSICVGWRNDDNLHDELQEETSKNP